MSTRADEVSIHAVSPESILAASSASAGTAPPTSASAPTKTPARHGSVSLHDRFMIAMLVPPGRSSIRAATLVPRSRVRWQEKAERDGRTGKITLPKAWAKPAFWAPRRRSARSQPRLRLSGDHAGGVLVADWSGERAPTPRAYPRRCRSTGCRRHHRPPDRERRAAARRDGGTGPRPPTTAPPPRGGARRATSPAPGPGARAATGATPRPRARRI